MAEERTGDKAVVQQPSGPEQVIVTSFYARVTPQQLFDYWTRPHLLTQWWPGEAELEARPGGSYHMRWPAQDLHLRGEYEVLEPGSLLVFSWRWDHEAFRPTRKVAVDFRPVGDIGTQVTVTHGTYTTFGEDQQERQGHLEGWTYFLTRLHDALA